MGISFLPQRKPTTLSFLLSLCYEVNTTMKPELTSNKLSLIPSSIHEWKEATRYIHLLSAYGVLDTELGDLFALCPSPNNPMCLLLPEFERWLTKTSD